MSDQTPTTYTITNRITSSSTATPSLWNNTYDLIQEYLNDLSARVSGITNDSAILQYDAPVSSDTTAGDVVYYNTLNSRFEPALAALRSTPGVQGLFLLALSSRVLGLVIKKNDNNNTATIIREGYWDCGSSCILHFAGGTATGVGQPAGIYYVDANSAGYITNDPGYKYRQPCISYYGDGKFSVITNYMAHDNHRHTALSIASSSFVPVGSSYQYTVPDSDFGYMSKLITAVFVGGVLSTENFTFSDNIIKTDTAPAGEVTVFNTYPFTYGEPVVRTILTDESNRLKIDSSIGGKYKLSVSLYSLSSSGAPIGKAISDLSGNTKIYTPVVTAVQSGYGTSCKYSASGLVTVSTTDYLGNILVPDDIINNGTQMAASGMLSYLVFPASVYSSAFLIINYRWHLTSSFNATVWVMSKGPGTGTLDVSMYWLPWLNSGSVSLADISTPIAQTTITLTNSDASKLTAATSLAQLININGPGKLILKLTAVSPASAINLSDYGCILNTVE